MTKIINELYDGKGPMEYQTNGAYLEGPTFYKMETFCDAARENRVFRELLAAEAALNIAHNALIDFRAENAGETINAIPVTPATKAIIEAEKAVAEIRKEAEKAIFRAEWEAWEKWHKEGADFRELFEGPDKPANRLN